MKYERINRKISHWEMTNYPAAELMKRYKMDGREFEQQVRHECGDGTRDQMKEFMQKEVYNNKEKRG